MQYSNFLLVSLFSPWIIISLLIFFYQVLYQSSDNLMSSFCIMSCMSVSSVVCIYFWSFGWVLPFSMQVSQHRDILIFIAKFVNCFLPVFWVFFCVPHTILFEDHLKICIFSKVIYALGWSIWNCCFGRTKNNRMSAISHGSI